MTERVLIVHAGGPKTGSSALQNYCEINASRLESLGFAYENRLNIKSDYEITSGNGLLLFDTLRSVEKHENPIDESVLSYFGQCNNAICSSEYLSGLKVEHWRRLVDSCKRLGATLKVVYYVRDVIPFIRSDYDQVIKRHGEWRDFSEWVKEAKWAHVQFLKTLVDAIPAESLHVVHYDVNKMKLIDSFFSVTGIDTVLPVSSTDTNRVVNRSLTNEERAMLRKTNRILGEMYSAEISDRLIYANPTATAEPVAVDNEVAEQLTKRFTSDVEWVNTTFFGGQQVVSLLPMGDRHSRPRNRKAKRSDAVGEKNHRAIESEVLDWVLQKLAERQQTAINQVADRLRTIDWQNAGNPLVPNNFDPIAYLLLNVDVLMAGIPPYQHFIVAGQHEKRVWEWPNQ